MRTGLAADVSVAQVLAWLDESGNGNHIMAGPALDIPAATPALKPKYDKPRKKTRKGKKSK